MADDGDVILDGKPISSLRVVDLKKECDKRGLQKSGSKLQLIERLKTQLLLENLGKDSDASGQQLQEDECQNEFIKQYLAQQKQLIVEHAESSMNSSSQESDTDDSPIKQRPVDQSPPMKSPPVEISPEKLAIISENPVQEVKPENKKKTEPDQIKKLVLSTEVADKEAEEEPKPAEDEVPEMEETHTTKSQSEGAVFEEIGRTKKRISRLDTGSKSQTDIPENRPPTRQSRRSRNSSSVGSEQDNKDVEKDVPVEAELVKQVSKQAETKHKLEQRLIDKENTDENMETELATNGKDSEVKPDTKEVECEKTRKIVRTPVKAASPKRLKSSSRSRSRSPAGEKKQLLQAQSSMKRPTRSSSTSSSSSSSSSSRSRSREKNKKNRRSSSSSSSRSRSRSRSQERTKKSTVLRKMGPQASRSNSSSRSRSRSPSPKRPKKQEERHLAKAPKEIEKQPEEQKSLEMQSETLVSQRSPSRSSSSRSGSSSPVRHDKVKTTAPVGKSTAAALKEQVTKQGIAAPISDKTESAQSDVKPTKKISLNRKNIEDAGKVKEEGQGDGDKPAEGGDKPVDGGDKPGEEKPAKKRRWGSRSASTSQKPKKASSLPISTDSLKGLIPDIKPALKLAPEPVLEDEMDYEDDTVTTETVTMEHEDTRSVKIQRTVTQDVNKEKESDDNESESEGEKEKEEGKLESSSEEEGEHNEDKREIKAEPDNNEEELKDKEADSPMKEEPTVKKTITVTTKVKKEKRDKNKEIKLVRRLDSGASALIQPDEPLKPRHSPSPARNPVSKIIHIRNLVRPFTVNQLKELLKRSGNLIEDQFWIDKIKSHCFAVYETEEEAEAARKALHNTIWPLSNPKTLIVDFGSEEQMDYYRGDQKPIPPPGKKEKTAARDKDQKEREERQKQLLEEREKEAQRRRMEREKRMKEREEREERNRQKPVREWDKDKKSREDWDRTLQKSRSRSPRERKRSVSGSPSKERRGQREDSQERMARRERRKVPEKKEDEPPAKLLDDLFKKTKTTPCIYWLPLTEAQIAEKEKLGFERPVLRQKQKGDGVSPIREMTEGDRSISRMRQTSSPPAPRKLSQEGMAERSRGRRESPGGRRQPGSPGGRRQPGSPGGRRQPGSPAPRSRSDGRRR